MNGGDWLYSFITKKSIIEVIIVKIMEIQIDICNFLFDFLMLSILFFNLFHLNQLTIHSVKLSCPEKDPLIGVISLHCDNIPVSGFSTNIGMWIYPVKVPEFETVMLT